MNTCLKFRVNTGPYQIVSASNDDTVIQDLATKLRADTGSIQLLGLLGNFFDLSPDDFWFSKQLSLGSQIHNPTEIVLLGRIVNSKTNTSHSTNSLSLVTYNRESLLTTLTKYKPIEYSGTLEEWISLVNSTPMSGLGGLMAQYNNNPMYNDTVFSDQKMTLTFSAMTQQDLDTFVSETGAVFNPTDMFSVFKSKLGFKSNGLPVENQPISVKIIGDEEVIVIEADASITTNLANLSPQEPTNT